MKHYFTRLQETMKSCWERPALANFRGEVFTYGEVATQIAKLHVLYEAIGLKKGDKVALCAKNSARWGIAFFSANTYEAVVVPILADFHPDSVNSLVDHSESTVLFTDSDIWTKLNIEKMPNVKVVYTRTIDKHFSEAIGADLQARADIAHRNNGDLFISIHSNAMPGKSSVKGTLTLVMGESTGEMSRNENALYANNKEELLDMSDQKTATIVRAYIQNLQFTYGEYSEMMARLIQEEYVKLGYNNRGVRRQPLKVLYATDMPSILTEIGFMSNAEDLKYITSEKGQDQIAAAIFRAVKTYTENVRRSLLLDSAPVAEQRPAEAIKSEPKPTENKPTTNSENKHKSKATVKLYAIQLLASVKHIPTSHPELKSYRGKVWILETNSSLKYKYCYGEFADKAMAQKHIAEVRKEFPQAFIISFDKTK
mgnify:CR=1 FL=1